MNTGQTLLTIIAIVLLGSNVVNINRTFSQHGVILQQTEIGIFGTSLAMSIIEEAQGKAFDEKTIGDVVLSTTELSSSLGKDGGEGKHPTFDDFDDYNDWADTVRIEGVDSFRRWARVAYVDSTNFDGTAAGKSWHKRLTVFVKASTAQDTLQMQYIFSYWAFGFR